MLQRLIAMHMDIEHGSDDNAGEYIADDCGQIYELEGNIQHSRNGNRNDKNGN